MDFGVIHTEQNHNEATSRSIPFEIDLNETPASFSSGNYSLGKVIGYSGGNNCNNGDAMIIDINATGEDERAAKRESGKFLGLPPRNKYDVENLNGILPRFMNSCVEDFRPVFDANFREAAGTHDLYSTVCTPSSMQLESVGDVCCEPHMMSNCDAFTLQQRTENASRLEAFISTKESFGLSNLKECQSLMKRKETDGISMEEKKRKLETITLDDYSTVRTNSIMGTDDSCYLQCKDAFPVQFEDFFVFFPGKIDLRPSYHSKDQIWPVGYKSSWHDKITGSVFVFHISDGGVGGPIFRVERYPCSSQIISVASTILYKAGSAAPSDGLRFSTSTDIDDLIDTQLILTDSKPPCLDADIAPLSDVQSHTQSVHCGHLDSNGIPHYHDDIGNFVVEGRSSSSVWLMTSQKMTDACRTMLKQNALSNVQCVHIACEGQSENIIHEEIKRFSHLLSRFYQTRSDDALEILCQSIETWLGQDRFGLDICFVQEIIEQLPGSQALSNYVSIQKRKKHSELQTVGNGFLLAKKCCKPLCRKLSSSRECSHEKTGVEHHVMDNPWPPGNPVKSQLPKNLMGNGIQFWELLWHFSEVIGLQDPVPFHRLEEEHLDSDISSQSYLDLVTHLPTTSELVSYGPGVVNKGNKINMLAVVGDNLARSFCLMLKILFYDLQSKVAITLDEGEWKIRKRRKLNADKCGSLNHQMFDLLRINELTWPELARRYLLNLPIFENNIDKLKMQSAEDLTVLCCLQGHVGKSVSSFHNGSQLQADAQFLAEAVKKIYGKHTDVGEDLTIGSSVMTKLGSINEGEFPEWVRVLEPARKLPTNVGARIRNCVNEALSRNPPEWARKRLEYSISKEVYKGNASGPTKKVILSVLADVSGNNEQQKTSTKVKHKLSETMPDLITRQCQKVLRLIVSSDEGKQFFSLRGKIRQSVVENDDEIGNVITLGYSPLDLRYIDIRLECCVYTGSHVAFAEDVREVLNKMRFAYTKHPDLLQLVEALSQKFELLYENEVLIFVHNLREVASKDVNIETSKEMECILELVGQVPIAAWDDGICKVCGVDKDDDNVLLCDKCDSGYHTYCLNPPLAKIPGGNWYCPSCSGNQFLDDDGSNMLQPGHQFRKRKRQEGNMNKIYDAFSCLRWKMEVSDIWEYNVREKISLLKILSDKLLQSTSIQDYLEKYPSVLEDMDTEFCILSSEWRKLNNNGVCILSSCDSSHLENGRHPHLPPTNNVIKDSSPCVKLNAEKQPMRKDFLGCDASGRHYWSFSRSRQCPLVVIDAGSTGQEEDGPSYHGSHDNPISSELLFYHTHTDIIALIKWLESACPAQRVLIDQLEKISSSYNTSLNGTGNAAEQPSSKPLMSCSNYSRSLMTDALSTLRQKYGSLDVNCATADEYSIKRKLLRCGCLELLWPGRDHCQNCHCSFSVSSLFAEHKLTCTNANNVKLDEENGRKITITKHFDYSGSVGSAELSCPYNMEEISSRFRTKSSNMDLVKEIGLLGSDGIPLFLQSPAPYLSDPALRLTSYYGENHNSRTSDTFSSAPALCNGEQSSLKCTSQSGKTNGTLIGGSSLKTLVGKGQEMLRLLKINLLDMDAAIPEEFLKSTKASHQKRCAWRAFVKSTKSVYEMVQATVLFEDSIKAEYLKNEWWYWSSLSATSSIATVSSLALRIYALDASIYYTKLSSMDVELNDTSPEIQPKIFNGKAFNSSEVRSNQAIPEAGAVDSNVGKKPLIKYLKKR